MREKRLKTRDTTSVTRTSDPSTKQTARGSQFHMLKGYKLMPSGECSFSTNSYVLIASLQGLNVASSLGFTSFSPFLTPPNFSGGKLSAVCHSRCIYIMKTVFGDPL